MLTRRLTTILPMMTVADALETTRIHSVAGLTGARTTLVTARPFWAPHHPISEVGLIGGGHLPRLGEVSLVDHGVLFLDELLEFRRHVLEVLRRLLGRVSQEYNFPCSLDANLLASFAARLLTLSGWGRVQ